MEEESAPKTQLRLKKRTLLVFVFCFFALLVGAVYFFLFSKESKTGSVYDVDKYGELIEHCEFKESGKVLEVECYAFLNTDNAEDLELAGQGERCISFLIPLEEVYGRNTLERGAGIEYKEEQICEKKEKISVNNPYENDFHGHLPVVLKLSYDRDNWKIFSKYYNFNRIDVDLMDDQKAIELLHSMEFSQRQKITVTTQERQEMLARGFYVMSSVDEKGNTVKRSFAILEGEIKDYIIDGDLMIFDIQFKSFGEERVVKAKTKSFSLFNMFLEDEQIITSSNLKEILDLNRNYQIELLIEGREVLDEDIVLGYISEMDTGEVFLLKTMIETGND